MKEQRKRLQQITMERKERRILAFMGDLNAGIVEVPNRESYVYVTIAFTGQVLIVKNNKAPTRLRYMVWLGYPDKSNRIQVLGSAELHPNDPLPDVPTHNHTWGESDNPAWVRQEQILSGGLPTSRGDMTVQMSGVVFRIDGIHHIIDNLLLDMTDYIPESGARWVNVEVDADKVISYNEGDIYSVVESREALTYEYIPETDADKVLLFSVKTYVGQSQIIQTVQDTDIFDPRFIREKVSGDGGGVESVVAGSGISVNSSDPANPVVSATGGGGAVFQRNLTADLTLADGECLTLVGYINLGEYDLQLADDAELQIL